MSDQTASNYGSEIKDAIHDGLPVLVAVFPFGALFAALAVGQGLSPVEVMFASATIFAGASQYAALDMLGQQAPYWAIVLTVFAINFRHILYSANIGRALAQFSGVQKAVGFFFLSDPLFASAESRRRQRVLQPSYYFTYALVLYCNWMLANLTGVLFGALIDDPARYGFDMILPIYFLGLVLGFRNAARFWQVVLVSGGSSLIIWATLGAPWHVTLGGLFGIAYAALISSPKKQVAP